MKQTKSNKISAAWKELLVGQDHVIDKVSPYIIRAMAGLNSPGRPLAVVFMLGPTGTGKTRAAETLAQVLHGSDKQLSRIDCAEFQMEHEVAKVIGAPPGYLGHRETQPLLTQTKLAALVSEKCNISIILFDEIEKAHASLHRVLLGIMDKATLRLGDNSSVSFERSIIFLSSNLAAKEIGELFTHSFGFGGIRTDAIQDNEIEKLGLGAMNKKFPPEFPNRLDEIVTFKPLYNESLLKITDMELKKVQDHVKNCLGNKSFTVHYETDTLEFLTAVGTSQKYGARELKRAINRYVMNPLADDIVDGNIPPGCNVEFSVVDDHIEWDIEPLVVAATTMEQIEQEMTMPAPTTERRRSKKKEAGN